jgi:hypothetical protein
MYYKILDMNTDKELGQAYCQEEINELVEYLGLENGDYYVNQVIPCRGCKSDEAMEQSDAHGISTGYWCDPCYNSSKYPYKKDRYPTIETHGYGERLNDDY